MKLKFLNGSLEGKALEFDGPLVTIGREDNNILVLSDAGVSSRHAYFEKIDGKWMVFDSNSTNGVMVNGKKIDQKSDVYNDDEIRLGFVDLTMEIEGGAKRPGSSPKVDTSSTKENQKVGGIKIGAAKIEPPKEKKVSLPSKKKEVSSKKESPKVSLPGKKKEVKKSQPVVIKPTSEKKPSIKIGGDSKETAPPLSPEEQEEALRLQEEIKEQKRQARRRKKLISNLTTGGILLGVLLLLIIFVPKFFSAMDAKQQQMLADTEKGKSDEGSKTVITYVDKTPPSQQKPKEVLPKSFPLYIQSYPTDATIEIDGEVIGKTPLEIPNFKSGPHVLTMYKEGFKSSEYYFQHPQSPIQIHSLEQNDYTIMVTSTPSGAAVTVGGQLRGHTPMILRDVEEGFVKISLAAQGFSPKDSEVEITASNNRRLVNIALEDYRGTIAVVTRPPGCKVKINGDFMGISKPAKKGDVVSAPFLLDNVIPGTYDIEVTSTDESEKSSTKIEVKGGETTTKNFEIWMINSAIALNEGEKIHGMIVSKEANGDIIFSEEKGKTKRYKKDEIASIEESSLQKKFGFSEGLAIDKSGFKPLLATIHDENDDTDYDDIEKSAKSLGKMTASAIISDAESLDLIEMVTKYRHKKITVSGSVSFIREGEAMYSIVLDQKVECYLEKDDSLVDKLKGMIGSNVTLDGVCIGVRGIERVVIMNTKIK